MLDRESVEQNLSALRQLLDSSTAESLIPSRGKLSSPAILGCRETTTVGALLAALHSKARVSGSTHVFYRYPARFSPQFARAVIENFSLPGDVVLDPFVGGGTSAVEAISTGRSFIGSDLNPLACFVSRTKITALSESQLSAVEQWAAASSATTRVRDGDLTAPGWDEYTRNIPWHLRRACAHLLLTLSRLPPGPTEQFARCSILSAMQKALDCRTLVPTVQQFLRSHTDTVKLMSDGMRELNKTQETFSTGRRPSASIFQANAAMLSSIPRIRTAKPPSLVITSPPYVDVHVLYNRWQILGRRETKAPYWIIDKREERGPASFTFAARGRRSADAYMQALRSCFSEITCLLSPTSTVVQLVAFHDPATQLDLYLETLEASGLRAVFVDSTGASEVSIGRRSVPNRRWYAQINNQSKSSKEFLLIHRKKHS